MNDETSHEQLQRLAAKHRAMLPHDDARQQRLLQILMNHSGQLEQLIDEFRATESPRDIAMGAALAFAMGEVMRVARVVMIQTAEASRQP